MPEFFDSTIVCNTGPIIGLSRVGLSHLIGPMFAKVLLPEAVVAELRAKHAGDADQIEHAISLAQIISLAHPPDPLLIAGWGSTSIGWESESRWSFSCSPDRCPAGRRWSP